MATHISGGSLGFAIAPLCFAPAVLALGATWAWLVALPGSRALGYTLRLIRRVHIPRAHETQHWGRRRPYVKPLGLLYAIVVLRTLTANSLAVFLPVLLTGQGMGVGEASAAVSLYLFVSTVGGFFGGPLADIYGAASGDPSGRWSARCRFCCSHSSAAAGRLRCWSRPADCSCSRRYRSTSRSASDRPGQRGDGVIADDGLCVGRRIAAGAGRRAARGSAGVSGHPGDHRGRPAVRGDVRAAVATAGAAPDAGRCQRPSRPSPTLSSPWCKSACIRRALHRPARVGPLGLTRMKCADPSLHDQIVKQWTSIRSFIVKDGHLFLALMADGGIYEFEPLPSKKP